MKALTLNQRLNAIAKVAGIPRSNAAFRTFARLQAANIPMRGPTCLADEPEELREAIALSDTEWDKLHKLATTEAVAKYRKTEAGKTEAKKLEPKKRKPVAKPARVSFLQSAMADAASALAIIDNPEGKKPARKDLKAAGMALRSLIPGSNVFHMFERSVGQQAQRAVSAVLSAHRITVRSETIGILPDDYSAIAAPDGYVVVDRPAKDSVVRSVLVLTDVGVQLLKAAGYSVKRRTDVYALNAKGEVRVLCKPDGRPVGLYLLDWGDVCALRTISDTGRAVWTTRFTDSEVRSLMADTSIKHLGSPKLNKAVNRIRAAKTDKTRNAAIADVRTILNGFVDDAMSVNRSDLMEAITHVEAAQSPRHSEDVRKAARDELKAIATRNARFASAIRALAKLEPSRRVIAVHTAIAATHGSVD